MIYIEESIRRKEDIIESPDPILRSDDYIRNRGQTTLQSRRWRKEIETNMVNLMDQQPHPLIPG
ncbi:MAG: hypothetical protein WBZ36_09345 [Candidatus Nitrosopolaris sp.]